jgi:hexosaminidase
MPGHSSAALRAYPELACPVRGGEPNQRAPDVYCAGNEQTFAFLEDVLTEICQLFPGKYIHVGGDEVSKRTWRDCPLCQARMRQQDLQTLDALQSYFLKRIGQFLQTKDRSLVGWSEISRGELPAHATVMDWLGGGEELANHGYDVVRCPNTYCYFDYYQSKDRSSEPPASGAFLPLDRVYSFEPLPETVPPLNQSHILGAQANLWTEYVPSLGQAEYMMFPRLCALSEVVWSPQTVRDWNDFRRRLDQHCKRLDQLKVKYRKQ